ncbi:MAG: hypothetical protein LBJ00_11905 [Planctomycetaceae bacterium]|nr:hypothetical protein [Planctomycetaceae bacterium]
MKRLFKGEAYRLTGYGILQKEEELLYSSHYEIQFLFFLAGFYCILTIL